MKITQLRTDLVEVPLDKPVNTAIHSMRSIGCVLLTLETDKGLTGEGFVFSLNAARLRAFDEMIKGFSHQLIGEDPRFVGAIWQRIWAEINPSGHKGVTVSALAAIDTACWDLMGKAANMPLHHVFGACRDRIKTYASGGLWLSTPLDELAEEAVGFVEQGFRAMKLRLGSDNIEADVCRVREVRNAVGPNIELMADLNQILTPKKAIQLGRRLGEFNLLWLEEPVSADDLAGHAQVTAALDIAIASGETEYSKFGMQAMLDANACDILMPDLQRVGGLTEMRNAGILASARHKSMSTHIFTEYSLCIAGSAPNCINVEHIPWYAPLFNESLEMVDGELLIPQRPGTGFTFNQDAIKEYAWGG